MLVLWRKNNQWLTITHRTTGEQLRIKVFGLSGHSAQLGFDDIPNNFDIQRDEREGDPHAQRADGN